MIQTATIMFTKLLQLRKEVIDQRRQSQIKMELKLYQPQNQVGGATIFLLRKGFIPVAFVTDGIF